MTASRLQTESTTTLLTPQQLRHYNAFGYVILKQFFSPDELRVVNAEVDQAMAANYSHETFDGSRRHFAIMTDKATPFFASLLDGPRLYPIAQQMHGEQTLGTGADANRYVGNSGWHRDSSSSLQGVKFALYLQPVGPDTGALRVIPGSHRISISDSVFADGVCRMPLEDVPATALVSEPGDVVAFNLQIWHGSFGGRTDRRMCTVVFYKNPETPEEIAGLMQSAEFNATGPARDFHCKRTFMYSAEWVRNPARLPQRQKWIDRLNELGYFDVPGLVEKSGSSS